MWKKQFAALGLAFALTLGTVTTALAESTASITLENCGAYLFGWRPTDCGDGHYFVILSGGDNIQESDVVLNRGYDYAYTFNPEFSRPWGQVPDLVNVNGIWGIPENQASLPEESQPYTRIVLTTINKNLPTRERYIDVVHLPGNVASSSLPPEVRKYLINTDGSDAGASKGTTISNWYKNENGQWQYQKSDGTYVSNCWLTIDNKSYYLDINGIMLADTITPDGVYVNTGGEKTSYKPGWVQSEKGWQYVNKNGSYASTSWIQDTDGRWYYFNLGSHMETDTVTPDGYYVDADGVWDGQVSSISQSKENLGPAFATDTDNPSSEESGQE